MRNTKQKQLVNQIVQSSYNHLSAKQIYLEAKKGIPHISLGTVYRILNELAENHQIVRITTKSGVDHFDRLEEKKHQHFICNNCGKIIDIFHSNCSYLEEELKNFRIEDIEITFTGLCNDCVRKESEIDGIKRI